jgi:hypothetical protein
MRKRVSEIFSKPYGHTGVCCEPSTNEIERAVRENDLEKCGFQEHLGELKAEWENAVGHKRYDQIRFYHARRIAFFVKNWKDFPITLKEDGVEVSDGSHRLRAAKYLGMVDVEVEIEGHNPETAD